MNQRGAVARLPPRDVTKSNMAAIWILRMDFLKHYFIETGCATGLENIASRWKRGCSVQVSSCVSDCTCWSPLIRPNVRAQCRHFHSRYNSPGAKPLQESYILWLGSMARSTTCHYVSLHIVVTVSHKSIKSSRSPSSKRVVRQSWRLHIQNHNTSDKIHT